MGGWTDARRFHQNFDHQRVAGSGPLARLVLTGPKSNALLAGRSEKPGLSGVEFAPPPPEQVASSPSDRALVTVAASQTSQRWGVFQAFYCMHQRVLPVRRTGRRGRCSKSCRPGERSGQIRETKSKGRLSSRVSPHRASCTKKTYNRFMAAQLRLMEQMIGGGLGTSWYKKYTTRQNQHFLKSIATSRSSSGSRSW